MIAKRFCFIVFSFQLKVYFVTKFLSHLNFLSAVLVKSISIVHNGHAVAANTTQSDIAFCLLLQVIAIISMIVTVILIMIIMVTVV